MTTIIPFRSTADLSKPDPFGHTELNLELETASLKSVVLIRDGVPRTLLSGEPGSLFTIRFTRLDLINSQQPQPPRRVR